MGKSTVKTLFCQDYFADWNFLPLFSIVSEKRLFLQPRSRWIAYPGAGAVAQLVEQRTENPCVAGSIPAHTTVKIKRL